MHRPVDVCIVTQSHLSANPRVVKEADALFEAGYSVSVIAPDYSAWGRVADKEFENRSWRVVERPQFGPLSKISTRIFELVRRTMAIVAFRYLRIESSAVLYAAWHPVTPALIKASLRQPAKLYIAHYPAALPAAAQAAKYYGARYAYDAEDFHPGDLPATEQYALGNKMVRLIERRSLAGCAYVTAASPGIAEAYRAEYGIDCPTVILNTFPISNAPKCSTRTGSAQPGPSIYWFSQTIGHDRGLQSAVTAVAISSCRPHLYLRGHCTTDFAEKLKELARSHGVEDQIHLLPLAAPAEMETLAANYDIGLCGEIGHTPNRRIALTNKQFTYLLAGIPVLMSSIPAHNDFALNAEGAVKLYNTNDEKSLAKAIDYILGDPEILAAMRAKAWQLGQTRFNWHFDGQRLVETVKGVLGTPSEAGRTTQVINSTKLGKF